MPSFLFLWKIMCALMAWEELCSWNEIEQAAQHLAQSPTLNKTSNIVHGIFHSHSSCHHPLHNHAGVLRSWCRRTHWYTDRWDVYSQSHKCDRRAGWWMRNLGSSTSQNISLTLILPSVCTNSHLFLKRRKQHFQWAFLHPSPPSALTGLSYFSDRSWQRKRIQYSWASLCPVKALSLSSGLIWAQCQKWASWCRQPWEEETQVWSTFSWSHRVEELGVQADYLP